jgi:hypothetical protein
VDCPGAERREQLMAATVEVLKTLQNDAAGLCPQCLSDCIADNAAILGDLIEIANTKAAIRQDSAEAEQLYQEAFQQVMTSVLVIAVFTGELSHRPVPFAVAASLN